MLVLRSELRRPLDLLAVGGGGRVAAACGTIGEPGRVEVWEVTTGAVRHRPLVSAREARGLALTPDGRFLLVADTARTTVFDLDPRKPAARPGPPAERAYPELALSADGRRLAVAEAQDVQTRLTLFEVGDGPAFREVWSDGAGWNAWYKVPAVAPGGDRLAAVRRGSVAGGEVIQVIPTAAGPPRVEIPGSAWDPVRQLAFSADGTLLFARPSGPAVQVYDAATGAPAGELAHPGRAAVTGLAVRPGDGQVAACRADGTVWVWEPAGPRPVRTLDWKLGKLVSVAFSPDGAVGAAGTEDGRVVVWDAD